MRPATCARVSGCVTVAPDEDPAPLADIEVGFSIEQAGKIVLELDALWAHSTRDGKKKVHELRRLHETLTAALADEETP